MKINESNKQRIHDVLISDLQRRIFKKYNERTNEFLQTDEDYDTTQTILYSNVTQCNTVQDVNELLYTQYKDLFENDSQLAAGCLHSNVFTLDGTLNYIFKLLR